MGGEGRVVPCLGGRGWGWGRGERERWGKRRHGRQERRRGGGRGGGEIHQQLREQEVKC